MKKPIFKVIGTLLLVTALVLTQIPAPATKATSVSDNNGFRMNGDKLVKYTGTDLSVSVPVGVRVIGSDAFVDCPNLTAVTLPAGLEEIENGAFSGCKYIKTVIIPEGCEVIGNGAFADCDALASVSLPSTLVELGTSVFAGCDSLKTVGINKGNPDFVCVDGVLYDDEMSVIYQVLAGRESDTYLMPNSVEEIKKYAFWGCKNLEEVGLSSYITEIGDYAFSNASGLESLVLPYSVRAIGTKSFEDCINLRDVTVPVSVTRIAPTAFDGCYNLRIHADEGTIASDYYKEFENNLAAKAEYEDGTLSENAVNPHWQEDVAEEENKTVRESKTNVSDVDNYIEWDVDSPGVLGRTKVVSRQAVVLIDTSEVTVYEGTTQVSGGNGNVEDSVDISAAIEGDKIVDKAFYQDQALIQVTIPGDVNTIGDFAFARSGLTSIQIPKGVTTIGNGAFYHCDNLSSVTIPVTVSEIGPDAFTNTKWLDTWYNGADVSEFLVVGDGVLLAYKGQKAMVTIPSNVRTIAPGVFKDHDEIVQITLPESVQHIGEEAFADCDNLSNISGGKNLSTIKDKAFYGCPIQTVRIPATIESIGILAFGGTDVTDSVVFLGDNLPKVTYEESATRLSNDRGYCFDGIDTVIVNNAVELKDLDQTVLDPDAWGFEGNIYTLTEISNGGDATLVACTDTKEMATIPENIYVYDKKYKVKDADKADYAQPEHTVSDNSIQSLLVVDHSELKKEQINVASNGAVLDLSGYHFYISNPGKGTAELEKQITKYYGEISKENAFFMDISMYDNKDMIPISKLGKNPITITMPVPAELLDDEICVITLDESGNPEVTFVNWSEKDGQTYISFDVTHFSPYVLYGAKGELKDKIAEKRSRASWAIGLDDTPNTGDGLNINLIFAIGMAALGAFFLLWGFTYKGGGRKKVSHRK